MCCASITSETTLGHLGTLSHNKYKQTREVTEVATIGNQRLIWRDDKEYEDEALPTETYEQTHRQQKNHLLQEMHNSSMHFTYYWLRPVTKRCKMDHREQARGDHESEQL